MICEVCDQPGAEEVFHQLAMHKSCAPSHWVKDHADQPAFNRRLSVWWATASHWKRDWTGRKGAA